jgi:hypothetical protein
VSGAQDTPARTPHDVLPPVPGLDVGTLARLFDDASNSYKHLFFRALLDEFREGGFKTRVFPLSRLASGMLASAWYPCRVHRLSLGVQDKVAEALGRVDFIEDGLPSGAKVRRALIDKTPDVGDLLRFVPYRLIAPFFARDLKGVPDHKRNVRIRQSADMVFWTVRPLYRFVEDDRIELHPDWAEYLKANFAIVSGWAERRWIAYLQSRNPLAPAVSEKIAPPIARAPLTFQTSYWSRVIAAMGDAPRCIYSGVPLAPDGFALDHFLPWTFVCHDALWNLVPVLPEANSAKGNRLPHRGYVDGMVALQHLGLVTANRLLAAKQWEVASAVFVGDLRISDDDILNAHALSAAYASTMEPQMAIARAIGFEADWRFVGSRRE